MLAYPIYAKPFNAEVDPFQRSQEQDGQVICFWSDQYPMPAEPEEELRGTWTTTLPERWKSYLSIGPSLHKSSKSTCYTLPSQGWQTTTPWLTRSQRPSLELLSSDGCLNWLQAWRVWDWPSWSSLGIFYQYPCYTWVSARAYNSSQGAIIGDWDRESREPCTPVIWDIFSLFFEQIALSWLHISALIHTRVVGSRVHAVKLRHQMVRVARFSSRFFTAMAWNKAGEKNQGSSIYFYALG